MSDQDINYTNLWGAMHCGADDAIRRHRASEGQRSGEGVEDMGDDQDKHANYGQAWPSGEGELRADQNEIRRASAGGGQPTVAVIGDFMEDRYWIGEATRLSAEVPIPIVKITDNFFQPGGAGNVATNLAALGCNVHWLNYGGMPPTKNRLMVGDHQLARWDERDHCRPYLGLFHYEEWDALVVADYGKGAITPEIIEKIKKFEGPIFVDTKEDPSVWSGVATAIFPNEKEYFQYHEQYDSAAKAGTIRVLKQGERGLLLYNGHGGCYSPAQARFVRSVNGAGDTVIAAFVYKYLTTELCINRWDVCLKFANAAAAIACEKPFTYAPTLKEVNERYYGSN